MRRIRGQNLLKEFDHSTIQFPVSSVARRAEHADGDSWARSPASESEFRAAGDMQKAGVRCNTLVLGMGSEFLGDDGLGVHALRELSKETLPPGTELIEVANHIVDALVALQRADRIILLDVLRAGGKPGSVYRVSFQPAKMSDGIPISHSSDLFRALYLGRCFGFLDVIVMGMEPSVIEWSATLSEEVKNALPLMVRAVRAELDRPVLGGAIEDGIAFKQKSISNIHSEDPRGYVQ